MDNGIADFGDLLLEPTFVLDFFDNETGLDYSDKMFDAGIDVAKGDGLRFGL